RKGRRFYVCSSYHRLTSEACYYNTVNEEPLLDAVIRVLEEDCLCPGRFDAVEVEMLRQLEEEEQSGEPDRLRRRAAELAGLVEQGSRNLALLPPDRLPGVVAQVRSWESEQEEVLARLREIENGRAEVQKILTIAKAELWRLREALQADDADALRAVLREL